jgi:hypothetical protein
MLIDAGGTVGGVGELLGVVPLIVRNILQGVSGSGDVLSAPGNVWYVSGYTFGQGDLNDPLRIDASGTTAGTGGVSLVGPAIIWAFTSGDVDGQGSFFDAGVPLPLEGTSSLAGYAEVLHLPPICPCPPPPYIELRWGQFISKDELPFYLRTNSGDRYAPFAINFTFFQVLPGGIKQRVGPADRSPIMSDVGDFYAVGIAGEGGQPGEWVVRWEWQRYQNGPVYKQEYPFVVLDAVLAYDPNDLTPRKCKYGWEE